MPGTPTTKYALPTIDGAADTIDFGDDQINALAAAVDSKMAGYAEGTLAVRPAAGVKGRIYRATNVNNQLYVDTGTAWLGLISNEYQTVRSVEAVMSGGSAGTAYSYSGSGTPSRTGVLAPVPWSGIIQWNAADYARPGMTTKWRQKAQILSVMDARVFTFYVASVDSWATSTAGTAWSPSAPFNTLAITMGSFDVKKEAIGAGVDAPVGSGTFMMHFTMSSTTPAGYQASLHHELEVYWV